MTLLCEVVIRDYTFCAGASSWVVLRTLLHAMSVDRYRQKIVFFVDQLRVLEMEKDLPGALSDKKIVESWHRNVEPWTRAVRNRAIESRRLITDRAIVDAVIERAPRTVLDLGCGEGWLARALNERGIQVVGVDVVPDLIERAREAGGGEFIAMSYESVAAGELKMRVDAVVCNFSLLGDTSVAHVLRCVPDFLNKGGVCIIQTLHPLMACGDSPYIDGWRPGSWAGFDSSFTDPAPWYFRTLQSWVDLFPTSGMRLLAMREPLHPQTEKPASMILVAGLD